MAESERKTDLAGGCCAASRDAGRTAEVPEIDLSARSATPIVAWLICNFYAENVPAL